MKNKTYYVYLVRHGESVANTQGIYQGQTYNTPLSLLGEKQASALGKRLGKTVFDQTVASPLTRTKTTAKFVNKNIVLEPRLLETNHGAWEGKHKDEIKKNWPELYLQWFTNPKNTAFPKGESFLGTQQRVLDWWNELLDNPSNTLVVSHDNILRIIVANALKMDLNAIWQFHLHPAAVTIIEIQNHKPKIICLNDTSHLVDLQADLSTHAL